MKGIYKIISIILLVTILSLIVISYKVLTKPPQTFTMCNMGGMIAIRAEPQDHSQVIYALSKYDKIWWSQVRTEHWLFIEYAHGSGWIEASAELGDCPPERKPPSIFEMSWVVG